LKPTRTKNIVFLRERAKNFGGAADATVRQRQRAPKAARHACAVQGGLPPPLKFPVRAREHLGLGPLGVLVQVVDALHGIFGLTAQNG